MTTKPIYIFIAIITMALWGFHFIVAKLALQELPLFTMLSIRFFIVSLLLIPFHPKPPMPIKYLILIAFIFSVLHIGANFGGIKAGLDAGIATLVEQASTPFLLLLSVIFLKEKIGIRSITGISLSIIGSFFLLQAPTSINSPIGFWLVLCGAFFWAVYCTLLKKLPEVPTLALIGWVSLFSFPITLIISTLTESNQIEAIINAKPFTWIMVSYSIFCASLAAHGLWYFLLSRMPIEILAPTTLLVPFFGIFGGIVFLGEQTSKEMLLGGLLMVIGVAIVLIRRPKTRKTDGEIS